MLEDIKTTMLAGELRKVKPRRFVMLGILQNEVGLSLDDWDLVFGDKYCYRIHRISGETIVLETEWFGTDWGKELVGIPDDKEIQVPADVYKQYLEQERVLSEKI